MKLFFTLCIYLIGIFLYRVLVTAGEYDSPMVVYMTIGLDLLCLVGLIPLRKTAERETMTRQQTVVINTVFVIALIAGLGSLAIRMSGDNGWWTGHLRYGLPARR